MSQGCVRSWDPPSRAGAPGCERESSGLREEAPSPLLFSTEGTVQERSFSDSLDDGSCAARSFL